MSSSWEGTADWSGLERMQSGGAGSRAVSARFATVSASSVSSVRCGSQCCLKCEFSSSLIPEAAALPTEQCLATAYYSAIVSGMLLA